MRSAKTSVARQAGATWREFRSWRNAPTKTGVSGGRGTHHRAPAPEIPVPAPSRVPACRTCTQPRGMGRSSGVRASTKSSTRGWECCTGTGLQTPRGTAAHRRLGLVASGVAIATTKSGEATTGQNGALTRCALGLTIASRLPRWLVLMRGGSQARANRVLPCQGAARRAVEQRKVRKAGLRAFCSLSRRVRIGCERRLLDRRCKSRTSSRPSARSPTSGMMPRCRAFAGTGWSKCAGIIPG